MVRLLLGTISGENSCPAYEILTRPLDSIVKLIKLRSCALSTAVAPLRNTLMDLSNKADQYIGFCTYAYMDYL